MTSKKLKTNTNVKLNGYEFNLHNESDREMWNYAKTHTREEFMQWMNAKVEEAQRQMDLQSKYAHMPRPKMKLLASAIKYNCHIMQFAPKGQA